MSIEWNGDGLPPVGCECEAFDGVSWFPVVIVGRYDGFAFAWNYDYRKTLTVNEEHTNSFRAIRTEAERKRQEAGLAIYHAINWNAEGELVGPSRMEDYMKAFDAIAAGKIPHITLK